VLIVGDSFTFGDGIDDAVTWPSLLEAGNSRLNVLNLAVTGYGPDQMYLTLREVIGKYRPQLVIAAYISDDLARSLLAFRDFKKPRFVLRDNALALTNTPIGSPSEVLQEIAPRAERSRLQFVNAARHAVWHFRGSESSCGATNCFPLNERIVSAMRDVSAEHGAEFLLVYLPVGQEMTDAAFQRVGETFFNWYSARHAGEAFFEARAEFLALDFDKAGGHYTELENQRLAAMIDRKIRGLRSWTPFLGE